MLLLSLCITACGEQTGADSKTEEAIAEDGVSAGNTAELERRLRGMQQSLKRRSREMRQSLKIRSRQKTKR